jgi:hypothetical protein
MGGVGQGRIPSGAGGEGPKCKKAALFEGAAFSKTMLI